MSKAQYKKLRDTLVTCLDGEEAEVGKSAYDRGPSCSLKEVRKLRAGDVIETYYEGTESPILEMVIEDVLPDEDHFDIKTVRLDAFTGLPRSRRKESYFTVNTDRLKLVGRMKFEHGALHMVTV